MKKNFKTSNIIGSISYLWFSSFVSAGLSFVTQLLLARQLTPTTYGVFAATLATITLFAPLAGFGVQGLWLKLFGAEGLHATRWVPASFRFITISTVATISLIAGWAILGPHDISTQRFLFLLMPMIFGSLFTELVSGKLQLEERYSAFALWQMLPNLARLLLVLFVIFVTHRPSLENIAIIYSMVSILIVILGYTHLRDMAKGNFNLVGHTKAIATEELQNVPATCADFLRNAWPFGLSGLFYLVYFQSDVIMLKYISGAEAAGIYNIAFTVMMAVYLLPSVIYQKFLLPKLHRWANHDPARFLYVYRVGNGYMLLLGGIAAVAVFLLVPFFVPLFFGAAYQPAVSLLSLLAFCIPVRFLATSVGATLVTQNNMQSKVLYMGSVAIVNVLLNMILIPLFAAKGAAVATLVSECTLLALYLYAVRRHVFGAAAWRGWTVTFRNGNG